MTNQKIEVKNSTIGTINQVAAKTINDSFNTAAESKASQEMIGKLRELEAAVKEMLPQLSEAQQKEAAQSVEVLTKEAVSEKPRSKWYDLSAEGLIEAANAIGPIANPVITATKAVLKLLVG